jgi:hypothetical protein
MSLQNQRVHFDKLMEKYRQYVELYKQLNNGSTAGVTPFGDFYIRYVYLYKYAAVGNNIRRG